MKINKNTSTTSIIESFVATFPYLKLAFYKNAHDHFHGSMKNDEIVEEMKLGGLNSNIEEGIMAWKGEMSVDNLESYMESTFGLHVQVFRKSGDIWLQTSTTDHWSLDRQNNHALENENLSTK